MTVFAPRGRAARQRAVARQIRLRLGFERALDGRARREIARTASEAADAVEMGGPIDIALQGHRNRMEALLRAHYTETGRFFGTDFLDSLKAHHGPTETKQPETTFDRLLQDWIAANVGQRVVRIAETTRAQINDAIAAGAEAGEGLPEIGKRIREQTGGVIARIRSAVIARTETHAASNAANQSAAEALEVPGLRREWLSAEDGRVRPTHAFADGQIVGMEQPFNVGGAMLMFPGDPRGPAAEIINCFPAHVRIAAHGAAAATRHWYEGELIEVRTALGNKLTGTPNHPVLTDAGWVSLAMLNEGCRVICRRFGQRVALGDPDIDDRDPAIGDVFDAALYAGHLHRVLRGNVDFHGDRPRHEVDVVAINGLLRRRLDSAVPEHLRKLSLAITDFAQGRLLGLCLSHQPLAVALASAHRIVSGLGQLAAVVWRRLRHACVHRFASGARGKPSIAQAKADGAALQVQGAGYSQNGLAGAEAFDDSRNVDGALGLVHKPRAVFRRPGNACLAQDAVDGSAGNAEAFGDGVDAEPRLVGLDHVIGIRRYKFAGHVYNLESPNGLYIAENFVAHNCRCSVAFLPEGFEE